MATSSAIGPLERLAASMKGEPDEELDRRFPGQRQLTDWMTSMQTVPWTVPLRNGRGTVSTRVLNPFAYDEVFRRRESMARILNCFSDEPKVQQYRQNTASFFDHINTLATDGLAALKNG